MSEILSPEETESSMPKKESRFGDPQRLIEIMMSGEIEVIGDIDDIYPETPQHMNEVDIADIKTKHANQILGVRVQKGGETIRCIFKPAKGENKEVKRETTVRSFYPRECAAYAVSEHFGFDLVPPTVIREVDGETGALQLFMDPAYYQNYSRLDDTEATRASMDWKVMAAFDWILANTERHADNMMVDVEHPDRIIAIDHGIILNPHNYFEQFLRGPMVQLTQKSEGEGTRRAEKPVEVEIPEDILEILETALARKDELSAKLTALGGIETAEIELMWKRVEDLLRYKVFLSRYNFEAVSGKSYLSEY